MQAVGEPAAEPDDPRRGRAQHDVHAVTAQPRALEVGRRAQGAEHAQPCALRRRRARGRQLEQHGLVDAVRRTNGRRPRGHAPCSARVAAAPSDRRRRVPAVPISDASALRSSRLEPLAAPPPAGERKQQRESGARPQHGRRREEQRRLDGEPHAPSARRDRRRARLPGRTTCASREHEPLELLEASLADPRHRVEVGDRMERAVRLPVIEDFLRGRRPDAREARRAARATRCSGRAAPWVRERHRSTLPPHPDRARARRSARRRRSAPRG